MEQQREQFKQLKAPFKNSHSKKTRKMIGTNIYIILQWHTINPLLFTAMLLNSYILDSQKIWPKVTSPQEYADKIFQEIETIRAKAREKSSNWNKTNITYRNQKRLEKSFPQVS
jgi:hypothetical protein